jgi:hypothetical protein
MLVFAAGTWEKLRNVPPKNLAYLGLAILVLIVAIYLAKQAARMNRIIFVIISGTILVVVTLTWVYQRNEPKFLSPVIDVIAPFFPSTPPPLSKRPDAGEPGAAKKPAGPTTTTTIRSTVY